MKYFNSLINIDFLGPKIGFEYKGSSNFQSVIGAFYSSIIIIITIVLAGVNWSDFYYRDNPLFASTSQQMVDASTIYLKEFPIVITFNGLDGNTQYEYLEKYFDCEINFGTMMTNGQLDLIRSNFKLERCDLFSQFTFPDNLKPELKIFQETRILYCANFTDNAYFRNPMFTMNSTYLSFRFVKCNNNSEYECPEDLDQIIQTTIANFAFINGFIDSFDYLVPIKYSVNVITTQLSLGTLKRVYFKFVNNKYTTDYGWIWSNNIVVNYKSYDSMIMDSVVTQGTEVENDLIWYTLESPYIMNFTIRQYQTVQGFLSDLGGLANILYMIIQTVTHTHLRFLYLFFLRNLALDNKYNLKGKSKLHNYIPCRYRIRKGQ